MQPIFKFYLKNKIVSIITIIIIYNLKMQLNLNEKLKTNNTVYTKFIISYRI